LTLELPAPIGKRELVFKRFIEEEPKTRVSKIVFTSEDLQSTFGQESSSGYPRAYFANPSGIIMRPFENQSEINSQEWTKIFMSF